MKKCPVCGFENNDTAGFCSRCGSPLSAPQPPPSSQPPNPYPPSYGSNAPGNNPFKRPMGFLSSIMSKKVLIAIVAVVAIVIVIVVVPGMLRPSDELITPSQASSVLGGSWTCLKNETYSLSLSNGKVSINYLDGTSVSNANPSAYGFTTILGYFPPSSGITSANVETMTGEVGGQEVSILAYEVNFNTSSNAKAQYNLALSSASSYGSSFKDISNNCFVEYSYGDSYIISINGNQLKAVAVNGLSNLPTGELKQLINDF